MRKILLLGLLLCSSFTWATSNPTDITPAHNMTLVTNSQVYWETKPQLSQHLLSKYIPVGEYHLKVRIWADADGQMEKLGLDQSSGNTKLDQLVLDSLHHAKLHHSDSKEIVLVQPFDIKVSKPKRPWWMKLFLIF
ncbi:TonB C-terminal domain-containing protein [Acinetobacter sp. MB5]|uniref:TonB C-terminal domain-containing protein n=1 Tax=Acinetobacter sp. MB5 TaxID=2069438 RepID=UPI000DD000D6|nr:TonB C-terminal domain-containing protein [Acinetobacter sp. MB5]